MRKNYENISNKSLRKSRKFDKFEFKTSGPIEPWMKMFVDDLGFQGQLNAHGHIL